MFILKLNRWILILLFIVLIFFYALNENDTRYFYIILIPFIFIVCNCIELLFYKKYSLMLYFLYVLSLIKYFVMPFMILFSGNIKTSGALPSDSNFFNAVLISCFEIIFILIAKSFFLNSSLVKNNVSKYLKNFTLNINYKAYCFILFFILIYLIDKNKLLPKDIFIDRDLGEENLEAKTSLGIIAKWIKLIGFPVISLFIYKYFKRNSYIINLLIFIFFGYLQIGTSRWTLIFYSLISFVFLYKIYGKRVKKIIFPISLILIFIILSISIFKFSWAVKDSNNKFKDVLILMGDQFQPYFSGPTLIAQCIEISESSTFNYKIGLQTFINDYMGSVPILSSNFDQTNRLNYIFNEYIFGIGTTNQTQIIPMSGVGYIYFGFWLSAILIFIATYIGLKLEKLANKSNDLVNYWILIYMAIWCMSSIIFTTQILWANVITNYLVLYIFNNIFNKISIKK